MDEGTLNDLLECSVCLERLDTSSKVLPCQHTFCRKCLEVIVSSHQELRCPECRILVDIKIDDLPPNVLLMRILEGMKNAAHNQIILKSTAIKNVHNVGLNNQQHCPQQNLKFITNTVTTAEQSMTRPIMITNKVPISNIPHAKAMYDFTSKDAGDLSFKKGDSIMLRRRIDHNWCIGELNGREGAFPLNHVQILLPLPIPQCIALYDFRMGPNEEEGCLLFKKGSVINVIRRVDHNWAEGRMGDVIGIFPIAFVEMNTLAKQLMEAALKTMQQSTLTRVVPPTPYEMPQSSDSSSTSTSPNSTSTSNTSSNTSTAPSSPITNLNLTKHQQTLPAQPQSQPQQQQQNIKQRDSKEKRHSLTALLGNNSIIVPQSNRLSAEILSIPDNESKENPSKSSTKSYEPLDRNTSNLCNNNNNKSTPIPVPYVALYPYKPIRSDELALKKGAVYYVTEICQDGWFKGHNTTDKTGVFPGNYVTPLRNREITVTNRATQNNAVNTGAVQSSHSVSNNIVMPPPELPLRNLASGSSSIWSKSVTRRINSVPNKAEVLPTSTNPVKNGETSTSKVPNVTSPPSSSNKEKKESTSSAISLMKRLTNIKRSKSPTSATTTTNAYYSMDNPVFEDVSATASASSKHVLAHPVHVRSGSCPSQLLQNLPHDNSGPSSIDSSNPYAFGSQRTKGHKERPSLQGLRNNIETNVHNNRVRLNECSTTSSLKPSSAVNNHSQNHTPGNNTQQSVSHHRKSQSLDASTMATQLSVTNNSNMKNKSHSSHVRERFRCIVPYPPNSEYELELHVGDLVFVHKKRDNGWYKGTHQRTGKTGLFPASFVEPDL